MTAIRSDISRTSSSSAETSRTAVPASRFAMSLPVDELDAADVEAARRLVEDEQLEVPIELAGDDDLLLVAARQRPGRDARRRASGCRYSRDALGGRLLDGRRRRAGPRARTARGSSWSGPGCRPAGTAAPARTGGGRPGRRRRPPRSSRAGVPAVTSCAGQLDPAARRRLRSPMIASTSSSWPLPATPAMPEDLAGPDLEVDAADDLVAAVVGDLQAGRSSGPRRRDATRRGRPSARRSRPTMSSARSSSFVSDGMRSPTTLPRRMTVIRSAISSTS